MAGYYNKDELKAQLELENIFDLVTDLGGNPEYNETGLIAQTICHNPAGEGSHKLYYYENTQLFRCYTNCDDTFDIFDLIIKVKRITNNEKWELYDAMCYVASFFGLGEAERPDTERTQLEDWDIFKRHTFKISQKKPMIQLKEYNPVILTRFLYPRIIPWEKEGITAEVCRQNLIGFYPSTDQITIPHFDIDGRLIGVRGRFLSDEDADHYGKYRPLFIGNTIYKHPLSMNLYNLNKSKDNISKTRSAIIFESEKSCLMYQSYYGADNDISVACCGSSISSYQVDMLANLGVRELVIAFDRQFQAIGDDEFKRLKEKLIKINKKYGNRIHVTAIFDKNLLTAYKASPIDESKEKFEELLRTRIEPIK